MNRTTLAMLLFVAAVTVVGAQTPPAPARPVRPAEPTLQNTYNSSANRV